jgi:hypothetical protein
MFSLFGWTPSLRRMLRGRILKCGCSVGVYETRSGEVVQIVDARSDSCPLATHTVDTVIGSSDDGPDEPEPASFYSSAATP